MIRKANQPVNPRVTAIVILAVLAAVQWFWWRGLVMKPPFRPGGMMGGGGAPPRGPTVVQGRRDVQVDTFAGAPEPGDADGPGRNARIDGPVGLAIDDQSNLYVADSRNHRIRRIAPDGETVTLAGSEPGYADGPASQARFSLPCGVAAAPDGTVYVADTGNHRIRRVKDGQVTTLAGSEPGFADGQGAAARFNTPCALTFTANPSPGLLVADTRNRRIRWVSLSGKVEGGWAVPGPPSAVLAGLERAVAVPQAGVFLIGSRTLRHIPIDPQGQSVQPGEFALYRPLALYPAPDGMYGHGRTRRRSSWFATDARHSAVFHLHDGRADVIAGVCRGVGRIAGWRDTHGQHAHFGTLCGVVYDGRGHVYVSDTSNNSIRRITLPPDIAAGREELP